MIDGRTQPLALARLQNLVTLYKALGGLLLSSIVPVQHTFVVLALFPAILCGCAATIGMFERKGRIRPAA